MATIVNTPGTTGAEDSSSSAMGFLMAIVLLLIIGAILLYFAPGFLRGITGGSGTTQVNVPDKINVDVNQK